MVSCPWTQRNVPSYKCRSRTRDPESSALTILQAQHSFIKHNRKLPVVSCVCFFFHSKQLRWEAWLLRITVGSGCETCATQTQNKYMCSENHSCTWHDHVHFPELLVICRKEGSNSVESFATPTKGKAYLPNFISQLIFKETCFIYLSHWSPNLDCTDSSLWLAKNKVLFYCIALLSGFYVHKWAHKLQSFQGIKKLTVICFFMWHN